MFKKILKWTGVTLLVLFVLAEIIRAPFRWQEQRTAAQVEKIHNTKLQMADVMGDNLPPDPGAEADKTVAGVDANKNGIRDDVELAIFKEYPKSAKTRAVLLQYALALQMEFTQPIINKETVTAVAEKTSAGYYCVGKILSRSNMKNFISEGDKLHGFVENNQINNDLRKKAQKDFYQDNLGSYELPSICDIDLSKLPN